MKAEELEELKMLLAGAEAALLSAYKAEIDARLSLKAAEGRVFEARNEMVRLVTLLRPISCAE